MTISGKHCGKWRNCSSWAAEAAESIYMRERDNQCCQLQIYCMWDFLFCFLHHFQHYLTYIKGTEHLQTKPILGWETCLTKGHSAIENGTVYCISGTSYRNVPNKRALCDWKWYCVLYFRYKLSVKPGHVTKKQMGVVMRTANGALLNVETRTDIH